METIRSDRLTLMALDPRLISLYLYDRSAFFNELNLVGGPLRLAEPYDFLEEFEHVLGSIVAPYLEKHAAAYPAFSHWVIVEQESSRYIGGIGCFPVGSRADEAMVGYFIDSGSEGNGYASEALSVLLDWLWKNTGVRYIIADTPAPHVASQRVLEKNGFVLVGEVEEGIRWRLGRIPGAGIHG